MTLSVPAYRPETVFVITHRHDRALWGVHVTTGNRRAQVMAFKQRRDAESLADHVWRWKLAKHTWPNTLLDSWNTGSNEGFFSTAACDVEVRPSPLSVDQVELDWLLGRVALSSAALILVECVEDGDSGKRIESTYVDTTCLVSQQVDWLQNLFRLPDARK